MHQSNNQKGSNKKKEEKNNMMTVKKEEILNENVNYIPVAQKDVQKYMENINKQYAPMLKKLARH